MSTGPSQAGTAFSRTGFLKTAAVSLAGAGLGVGVIGQPVEKVHAAEPLVETCEEAISPDKINAEIGGSVRALFRSRSDLLRSRSRFPLTMFDRPGLLLYKG